MNHTVKKLPRHSLSLNPGSYVRPAEVIEAVAGRGILVKMSIDGFIYSIPTQPAMGNNRPIPAGTRVLVAGEDLESGYIIGILDATDSESSSDRQAGSASGASVQVVTSADQERILVRDADQQMIFEYDPVAGTSRVAIPWGDLELSAPNGDIRLQSGKRIHLHADNRLVLQSDNALSLEIPHRSDHGRSRLHLDRSGVSLNGGHLGIKADDADLEIDTTTFRGRQLTAAWERAKLIVGKLETIATRLLERAKNSTRIIENLHEIKAGRMRAMIRKAFHLQSKNASILAEEDIRVDGNRINLG